MNDRPFFDAAMKHVLALKRKEILTFLDELRQANPIIEDVFLNGSCFNLYFMLRAIYSDAECYCNHAHIITKIDGHYYDITGEVTDTEDYVPLISIWASKYRNEGEFKMGDMYITENKVKYKRVENIIE